MPSLSKESKSVTIEANSSAVDKFRRNFPAVKSPEEELPTMPKELTKLKILELGNLMSQYSAWREFAEDMLSTATAEYMEALNRYNFEYSKMYVIASGKVTDKKEELEADPRLHEMWMKVLEKKTYSDLLSDKVASLNASISVLSRDLTRRGQTNENRFDK